MSHQPSIAILVETSTSWGAQIVRGIADYSHRIGPWRFYLEPRGRYEQLCLPTGWQGDGVIARVTTQPLADDICATGLPAVNVSWYEYGYPQIARCTADEHQCGIIAAQHFLDRGLQHFAYCGPSRRRTGYTDRFGKSFVDALAEAGFRCGVYHPLARRGRADDWQRRLAHLSQWLAGLPKPCGVLTFDDVRGRQVTEACHYAGIHVPDEVAVLGGESDDLMSAVSNPPLSSIDHAARRVGHEAAALLDRMMRGESIGPQPKLIPPIGIISRPSTDILTIDDEFLAEAIRFIRDHAHEGIQVAEVLVHVPLSRRVLEQRFADVLGRSPAAEIRRVRLERAKRMLVDTDLSMPQVAASCGFNQAEVFTRTFGREIGQTPTAYRRQNRMGGERTTND